MRKALTLAIGFVLVLAYAPGAFADCWCGNGYSDPNTNFVEAQVWPGDPGGTGGTTSIDFIYTTDGTDPYTSGTAQTEPGTFYQYAGNNDWYQAWLTASGGSLVRWFARALSHDGDPCDSEEYQFTSGATPIPNVVGDCESELGGTDWTNNDALTDMTDVEADGVWEVTVTATADFASSGGSGYQVVGNSGNWNPQHPGDCNIPISFTTGEEITFYIDTNVVPGWSPETNAVWDSKLVGTTHTWAAMGDWGSWDPANTVTEMLPQGNNLFYLCYYFDGTMLGWHEFKCAADDSWDLQCGENGFGSNCNSLWFEVTSERWVGFYLEGNRGRLMVELENVTGTEKSSWGGVKSLFR